MHILYAEDYYYTVGLLCAILGEPAEVRRTISEEQDTWVRYDTLYYVEQVLTYMASMVDMLCCHP